MNNLSSPLPEFYFYMAEVMVVVYMYILMSTLLLVGEHLRHINLL